MGLTESYGVLALVLSFAAAEWSDRRNASNRLAAIAAGQPLPRRTLRDMLRNFAVVTAVIIGSIVGWILVTMVVVKVADASRSRSQRTPQVARTANSRSPHP